MNDIVTLTGIVATEPRHFVTSTGLPITSFRLASAQRRFDRAKQEWSDASTNWYTVSAFRQLAVNAATSIRKGERVLVTGRLRLREWEEDERKGTAVEVDADALGHDLLWGTSSFTRSMTTRELPADAALESSDRAADDGSTMSADESVSADQAVVAAVSTPF